MDNKKLTDAITALKTVVTDAVKADAGVLVDAKATQEAKSNAGRSLNALGKISDAINKAEERINSAIKRSAPRAKKVRSKKAA